MNFKSNKLPSTSKEIEWYWSKCVKEDVDFSKVVIDDKVVNFNNPVDFFDITDNGADKISYIGRSVDFFSLGEAVKITTWASGFKGFLGMRNFTMETEDGEMLACAEVENGLESCLY